MGLYAERCGSLHVVTKSKERAQAIRSNLEILIRPIYSSPPKYGASIATEVLKSEELVAQWKGELNVVTSRIKEMREALYTALKDFETPGDWEHIVKQRGMFTYTGLSRKQCECLVEEKHIYLPKDGRVSVAGLNAKNVGYVAEAIDDVVRRFPSDDYV